MNNPVESRRNFQTLIHLKTEQVESGLGLWMLSLLSHRQARNRLSSRKGAFGYNGLSWSGRGSITRVDVSVDGAKIGMKHDCSREQNGIDGSLDIEWNGQEMFLQSRAHDETGYVQPTKAELREVRGLFHLSQ